MPLLTIMPTCTLYVKLCNFYFCLLSNDLMQDNSICFFIWNYRTF